MLRRWVGEASIALGTVWAWAGVARMIFGIRITLPIFPAVDLSRVEATPALLVGLSLVVLGAWLKRGAEAESGRLRAALGEEVPDAALGPGTPIVDVSRSRVSAVAKPRDGGP